MLKREIMYFPSAAAFAVWMAANHDSLEQGIDLAIAKKASTIPSVTYAEALDIALCYGWIDGQKNSLDADHYLQAFSHRRARSIWSQVNRDHVARLIEQGRMTPAGLDEVERAKTDGRWDAAYATSATIEVPEDLALALAASPEATAFFATLTKQNRFAILFRIGNLRRPETRARRVVEYVQMLERGETIYPQRAKG
jgi:uncharacterized protein YdeI (YjbR/CyaY-like superfamily)